MRQRRRSRILFAAGVTLALSLPVGVVGAAISTFPLGCGAVTRPWDCGHRFNADEDDVAPEAPVWTWNWPWNPSGELPPPVVPPVDSTPGNPSHNLWAVLP